LSFPLLTRTYATTSITAIAKTASNPGNADFGVGVGLGVGAEEGEEVVGGVGEGLNVGVGVAVVFAAGVTHQIPILRFLLSFP